MGCWQVGGALVVLSLSALAAADDDASEETSRSAEEDRIRQEAGALANRGYELFKQGDYNEAISLFEQAERLSHSPVILSYIAQSYEQLGKLLEAQRTYDAIVEEPLREDASPDFVRAQRRAREQAPLLRRRLPRLRLRLTGIDAGAAEIQLDGKPLTAEALEAPVAVNPGNRTVIVRAPGQPPVVRGFVAAERTTAEVDIVFASRPPPPPPPEPRTEWIGPTVAFGVGFAGLAVGVTTGALYFARSADLRDRCPNDVCIPELEPERDGINTLGIVSLVGLGVAAAGAATGLTLVLTSSDTSTTQVSLGPGGIATTLRF